MPSNSGSFAAVRARPPTEHGLGQARQLLIQDYLRFRGWGKSEDVATAPCFVKEQRCSALQCINWMGTFLVIFYIVFTGIRAQISMDNALRQQHAPIRLGIVVAVMTILFWLVIVARITFERRTFSLVQT